MLDDVKNSDIDKEKVLLVGIYGLSSEKFQAEEHLEELALLTDTAGGIPVAKVLQQRNRPDVSSYVGKGKLTELKGQMSALGAKTIILDDDLSPTQIRNVEKVTDAKVLDRSALILDIFASLVGFKGFSREIISFIFVRMARADTPSSFSFA